METLGRLKTAVEQLNAEARQLVASAASEGRFDEVILLTPIAKDISELADRWVRETESPPLPSNPESESDTSIRRPVLTDQVASSRATARKSEYPRFLREKEDLVKLGWSSREQGPYEHRVPKKSLDSIASALAVKGKSGHRFSMNELIESIAKPDDEGDVPSYQVYAAVLWLKWSGMLLQHGRQGYTIVRPQTFRASVETAWQTLPRR